MSASISVRKPKIPSGGQSRIPSLLPTSSIFLNLGVLVSQGCCERLTQPGGLEQQTFIFPQSGGQKPKIKVLAGSASSGGSEGGFGPCLSLSVCGCWQRSETQNSRLCFPFHTAFPSVRLCVSSSPQIQDNLTSRSLI